MQKRKAKFVLFSACLLLMAFCVPAPLAALDMRVFTSGTGGHYPPDEVAGDTEPNVLFFLDVSANMAMSMRGMRPIARDTAGVGTNAYIMYPEMMNANTRLEMLKQDTLGMGDRPIRYGLNRRDESMPPAGLSARELVMEGSGRETSAHIPLTGFVPAMHDQRRDERWGRDVNPDNNKIGDPNCYYSVYPEMPFFLTFRNRDLAEWRWGQTWPPAGMPAVLMPYLPTVTQPLPGQTVGTITPSVVPVPLSLANLHLIPNDSKMYNVKLVLSKLLAPTPDNINMLSGMRLGLATSFYQRHNALTGGVSVGMQRTPYRPEPHLFDVVNSSGFRRRVGPTGVLEEQINMIHNPGPGNVNNDNYWREQSPWAEFHWFHLPHESTQPRMGMDAALGVDLNQTGRLYGGIITGNSPNHHVRSIMHIPFDYMYRPGDYSRTPALDYFLELIDGVEQLTHAATYSPTVLQNIHNDELFITSIDGSVERWMYNTPTTNTIVVYAEGALEPQSTPARHLYEGSSGQGVRMRRVQNTEGLMTGTVVGTIHDIFHPRTDNLDFTAGVQTGSNRGSGDTRGYFPVTSNCQDNWIVYFTTGNEHNVGNSQNAHLTPGTAMHSLYNIAVESTTMRGRRYVGGTNPATRWVEENFVMDYPIRTIVVGLVSTEGIENDHRTIAAIYSNTPHNNDGHGFVRNIRNRIRRMAHAGQPLLNDAGEPIGPNYTIEPIFADNVDELQRQLHDTLASLRAGRMGAGAPRLVPAGDDRDEVVVFNSGYDLAAFKQWRSEFMRLDISYDKGNDELVLVPGWVDENGIPWDAGLQMIRRRDSRQVYTVLARQADLNSGVKSVGSLAGRSAANLNDQLRISSATHAIWFRDWLRTYQSTDFNGNLVDDNGVLGSTERSAPLIMPAYAPRRGAIPEVKPNTIYLQTNRGVLHAIDYATGAERWAFIPPQIFNYRIWRQKFEPGVPPIGPLDDKTSDRWLDGDGINFFSSRPMLLLDGLLTAGEADGDVILIGSMGLSGNGLYAMSIRGDIENPNPIEREPVFLWSIDNDRFNYSDVDAGRPPYTSKVGNTVNVLGDASGAANVKGWVDLGLTIIAAEIKITANKDPVNGIQIPDGAVGMIPGGLGWELGRIPADLQGKAFYVFDPKTAGIIKKITTLNGGDAEVGNGGFVGPTGSTLGMGVSPIYFIPAKPTADKPLDQIFTSDSEGNIMYLDATQPFFPGPMQPSENQWQLRTIFRARTLGEVDPSAPIIPVAPAGLPLVMPTAFELVEFKKAAVGRYWLFGGTADLAGLNQELVDGVRRQRALSNREQYIFALNKRNLGDWDDRTLPLADNPYIPAPRGSVRSYYNTDNPPTLADLTALTRTNPINEGDTTTPMVEPPVIGQYGWRMRLAPRDLNAEPPTDSEYLSASPHFNPATGLIYFATWTPYYVTNPEEGGSCEGVGFAKLYAFDPTTGRSKWLNEDGDEAYQAKIFSNMKIVGLSSFTIGTKSFVLAGVQNFGGTGMDMLTGSLAKVDEQGWPAQLPINFTPNVPHLQYMREIVNPQPPQGVRR